VSIPFSIQRAHTAGSIIGYNIAIVLQLDPVEKETKEAIRKVIAGSKKACRFKLLKLEAIN
jgi:hypothetical protein